MFSGVEYAITASCANQRILANREIIWDMVVKSFRLTEWAERDVNFIKSERIRVAGELYGRAYEEAAKGHYSEARSLLNECLDKNPNHRLAHKELAFLLKNMGNLEEALSHHQIVKQLDPSDQVNRFNLAGILFILKESDKALKGIEELLVMDPNNPRFLELKRIVIEQLKK
jgi:tetratricopeptide (TPR) repeat protein